jgi:hypothetical protein
MRRLNLIAIFSAVACSGGTSDTSEDTGPSYYNPDSGECEGPLAETGTRWPASTDATAWSPESCRILVQCPAESQAALGVEYNYIEYADYAFFDPDGALLSRRATTDGIDSEDPEDCLSAGIATWSGPPVRTCLPWSGGTRISWPSCVDGWDLPEPGDAPGIGRLTGATTWSETQAHRTALCSAQSTCEVDGQTYDALIRISYLGHYDRPQIDAGEVDVFNTTTGALVGTGEFNNETSVNGLVPLECLTAPAAPTAGCFLDAD